MIDICMARPGELYVMVEFPPVAIDPATGATKVRLVLGGQPYMVSLDYLRDLAALQTIIHPQVLREVLREWLQTKGLSL